MFVVGDAEHLPVRETCPGVGVVLHLVLQSLEPVQVRLLLLRQLSAELELVPLEFFLLRLESFPCFLHLILEKLRGIPGGRFAAPDVLFHEKGAQAGSDPHGDLGILVVEEKNKRILVFRVHFDPLPDLVHHGVGRHLPALFLEKTQFVDHSHEAGTTEDILLKHFEAITGSDVDSGLDHPLGHGRRDDEELYRGLIQVR
jgi:hypothetical protein